MSRSFTSAVVLSLVLFAGCASPPAAPPPKLLVGHEIAAELGYRIAWPADLGLSGDERILYAELLGDKFVTLETGNVVSVLNASNGQMLWRTEVGTLLERFGPPQRQGDRLVLSSETRCHLYDIQVGGFLDVIDLAHVSNTNPLIVNGLMIHGSPKGLAYGQSLETGLLVWSSSIGGAAAADPVAAGPLVIVPADTGWVFAFNPATGVPEWRARTFGTIAAQTSATESTAYVASEDGSLYAFARVPGPGRGSQGRLEWRYYTEQPLRQRPYVFGDNAYQFVPREGLIAIDAASGKKRWTLPWRDARPFMLKSGRLHVIRRGGLAVVTPDDGLVLQELRTPFVHDVVPQSASGGDLYLLHRDGRILKLIPQ